MTLDTPRVEPTKYTPSRALAELVSQHALLRDMMARCEELADALDREHDQRDPTLLTREVARLRLAFEAHNQLEEQLLRPVLLGTDAFGEVRLERMILDHIGEHGAIHAQLLATETHVLRDMIETLRAHLDAEERCFLSARVLRDDIINLEGGG